MATEKTTIASILLSKPGIAFISKQIKSKFRSRFHEKVIIEAVRRTLMEPINLDEVKVNRVPTAKIKKKIRIGIKPSDINAPVISVPTDNIPVQ